MGDEMRLREVVGTSLEASEAMRMADVMRDALVATIPADDWSPEKIGMAMTAAAALAGILFGQMIAIGAAQPGDRRRAGEGILKNFRTGIDLGQRNALTAMLRDAGGTVQ